MATPVSAANRKAPATWFILVSGGEQRSEAEAYYQEGIQEDLQNDFRAEPCREGPHCLPQWRAGKAVN